MNKMFFILFVALISSCSIFKTNNKMEQKFSGIIVFGDGLNDMGKWGKLTNYQYPPAEVGFYESRWTNGKVWVEHFAEALHLPKK